MIDMNNMRDIIYMVFCFFNYCCFFFSLICKVIFSDVALPYFPLGYYYDSILKGIKITICKDIEYVSKRQILFTVECGQDAVFLFWGGAELNPNRSLEKCESSKIEDS